MAADRATVNISASLLPDEIKTSVGGTTTYDLNDVGNTNKWAYSLTIVGNSNEDALLASVPFLGQGTASEGATATVNGTDDVVLSVVTPPAVPISLLSSSKSYIAETYFFSKLFVVAIS